MIGSMKMILSALRKVARVSSLMCLLRVCVTWVSLCLMVVVRLWLLCLPTLTVFCVLCVRVLGLAFF